MIYCLRDCRRNDSGMNSFLLLRYRKRRKSALFNIAICDDDDNFLGVEKAIISQYMDSRKTEYHIEQFCSGQALIALGQNLDSYSLILLDVEMEVLSGLETARKIREYSQVPIAFVTAYISYSLEGYKVNAIRYILKEMDSFQAGLCECLDTIMNQNDTMTSKTFVLDFREGKKEISIKDLVYIESRHHYCYFHVQNGEKVKIYSKRDKLDEIEKQLDNEALLRIHKSCLVNLSFVSDIKRYQMQLTTREILLIAQSKYLDTEKAYLIYCGKMDS